MTNFHPINVESATCRDCYKCVRHCFMKAVEIRNHAAAILSERCIVCGTCVSVCPAHAKKVRNDISFVKHLIETKKRVIVSLAPSALSIFEVEAKQLIQTFKSFGFWGVSETAIGAEAVSFATYQRMANRKDKERLGVIISSACPSAVDLVRRKFNFLDDKVAMIDSPMIAHGKMLRKTFGEDIGIVFIGPCIAKKKEADQSKGVIDAALTFEEVRRWLNDENLYPEKFDKTNKEEFLLGRASDGVLYPIEGGMIESICAWGKIEGVEMMSFSGIEAVTHALNEPAVAKADNLFLELLCCEGGCINGPKGKENSGSTVLERLKIREIRLERSKCIPNDFDSLYTYGDLVCVRSAIPPIKDLVTEGQIKDALKQIGKKDLDDELNCGGCGYNSCRDLARALVEGRAEKEMCVSHMRRLAMNKASALMATMPSGVVILDRSLCVMECNRRFAEILGEDILTVYDAILGLGGAHISKVFFAPDMYYDFLVSSEAFFEKEITYRNKILHISIFDIEGKEIIGTILQDITSPAGRRHRIVKNAEEAIRKNLATAQQIAYLLGENAAETEVLLQNIVRSFSMELSDD